jgi:DNA-binding LytR/AlgR family response regulator
MPLLANETTRDKLNLLILEDEELVSKSLEMELKERISKKKVEFYRTDNLGEAHDYVDNNQCDILLADLKVKEKHNSSKLVLALPLLRKIKADHIFINSVAHTAYGHYHDQVRKDGLADIALLKNPDDDKEVIDTVLKLFNRRETLKSIIRQSLNLLYYAASDDDMIDAQAYLQQARNNLGGLDITSMNIPIHHKKYLYWLTPFLMRLSTIDSPKLGIKRIANDIIEPLESMRAAFELPKLDYKLMILRNQSVLEALGYPCLIRIGDI